MMKLSLMMPAALVAVASGALFVACSSSSSDGSGGNADGGTTIGNGNGNGTCTSNSLTVAFAPMYSAFDGKHTFQIPAIVDGVKGTTINWSASDTSMVALAPDPVTGGVMITTQKAGTVTIAANAGGLCGSSTLTITEASATDWDTGNARYNDGIVLRGPRQDAGAGVDAGSPTQAACTNCHGTNAAGPFKDVAHTPEQTGGFSDDDLVNIFRNGTVPDGGYFDDKIVPYQIWQRFHNWDMTDEEAKGIVVYLRSLTPEPQEGSSNFGGRGDGGTRPPRDGGARDGSAPPPSDGGGPSDAGTGAD